LARWVLGEHVEAGAAEAPFGESGDKGWLIDDAAAADIYQNAIRPKRIHDGSVNKAL